MAILLLRRSPPVLRPTLLPLTLLGKIRGVRSLPALEEGNLQCPLIREEEDLRALLWFFLIFRASTASRGLAVETAMRPIEVQELSGSFFSSLEMKGSSSIASATVAKNSKLRPPPKYNPLSLRN
jgi:hypothetical protein